MSSTVGQIEKATQARGVADTLINRALHEFTKVVGNTSKSLYDRNCAVYEMLRYGIKVQPGAGENHVTVWLIDWHHPQANDFGVAEEVTFNGSDLLNAAKAAIKRPDVVLYVNGITLGVLELKRSTVSVSEGIRQNLDNQKKEFIQPFFSTMRKRKVFHASISMVRSSAFCFRAAPCPNQAESRR